MLCRNCALHPLSAYESKQTRIIKIHKESRKQLKVGVKFMSVLLFLANLTSYSY